MRLPRFRRKKKEEATEAPKPEVKKVEREFQGISREEQKKRIGKHVAIVDGKIIAAAVSADKVLKIARKKYPDEKIALRFVGSEKLLIKCKCLKRS